MAIQGRFTCRKEHRHEGRVRFAEVTVRAEPCLGESEVVLTQEVLKTLREIFGADCEHQRHCVWAAVSVQIASINVAGGMPHAGATPFLAEVIRVEVSGNAGRDLSGFLLSVAAMNAIESYLRNFERDQVEAERRMSGCSFRFSGKELALDECLARGPFHPRDVWRKGEPRGVHKPPRNDSGFIVAVDQTEGQELSTQISSAVSYMNEHRDALARVRNGLGITEALIDFKYVLCGDDANYTTLCPEFVRLTGELGLGIRMLQCSSDWNA